MKASARSARTDTSRQHRLSVTSRVLAGTLGAYVLTVQITVVLSFLLSRIGLTKVEAVTAATLTSFAVFAALSMAVFHASHVTRAWIWLVATGAPLALTGYILGPVQ